MSQVQGKVHAVALPRDRGRVGEEQTEGDLDLDMSDLDIRLPRRPPQVPLPPLDEKKKVVEEVDKDRKFSIDAAIVRTMKSRKVG